MNLLPHTMLLVLHGSFLAPSFWGGVRHEESPDPPLTSRFYPCRGKRATEGRG